MLIPGYTRRTATQGWRDMNAEIIAVGTELLMGETQDTNSSWLGQRLPELGHGVGIELSAGTKQVVGLCVRVGIPAQRLDVQHGREDSPLPPGSVRCMKRYDRRGA